jgi:RNA polymerase II subunit A small phosphatase-like protein
MEKPDIVIPIDIDNEIHGINILVRPGTKEFLKEVSKFFEIVIFTASISEVNFKIIYAICKCYMLYIKLFIL